MDENQNNGAQAPNQSDELTAAKQRAIDALSPLIHTLDASPERKFELSLNVVRLTGDKNMVAPTLESALAIEDTAKKADALVTLINEINFLQQA